MGRLLGSLWRNTAVVVGAASRVLLHPVVLYCAGEPLVPQRGGPVAAEAGQGEQGPVRRAAGRRAQGEAGD